MLIIVLSVWLGNIQETSLLYRNQKMKNQMMKSGMIFFMFLIILMNSRCRPKFFHFLFVVGVLLVVCDLGTRRLLYWAFVHHNGWLGCVLVIVQKALVHFERKT